MPRISQEVLNCVFFLYRTKEDAVSGQNPQGTGFIVGVPTPWPGKFTVYAITNWHVAIDGGASVIGLNKRAGGIDAIETEPTDWFYEPGGDDIAVLPLSTSDAIHTFTIITPQLFMTEEDVKQFNIGMGDDVFMVGLFVDHTAQTRTVPKARFGNISMMPDDDAPITQENGTTASSFVMDMHSRSGFSGSPVFMFRTPGADLSFVNNDADCKNNPAKFLNSPPVFCFAGLHWGQFPEQLKLTNAREQVEGLSGLTCVIPAWRIAPLLNREEFVAMRRAQENRFRAQNPHIDTQPRPEGVRQAALESDNPAHKEDFTRLLNAAAQTPPQDD